MFLIKDIFILKQNYKSDTILICKNNLSSSI